jgi:hypothetical protein
MFYSAKVIIMVKNVYLWLVYFIKINNYGKKTLRLGE